MKETFHFLKELRVHNNREWFNAHKEEYTRLRKHFETSVEKLIALMGEKDEELHGLEASSCIFRIYRDIRFSPDKTPYKGHFAAYIAKGGKNSPRAGYYLHIEPENCLLCGGIWCPQPPLLKALRQSVYDNCDEFLEILNDPSFKQIYHGLDSERALKVIPKPFPKDFPYPDLLKQRDYLACTSKDDTFFETEDWVLRAAEELMVLYPFNRFLNYTCDEMNG